MPALPEDVLQEFLAWLDIIPGRNWLAIGSSALEQEIRRDYRPSGVTAADASEAFDFADGTFDVAAAFLASAPQVELVTRMRRVVFPSGTVGLCISGAPAATAEARLREAGLHAVQNRMADDAVFVRGAR